MDFFELAQKIASALMDESDQEQELRDWRAENKENEQLYQRIQEKKNRENYRLHTAVFDVENGWKGWKNKQLKNSRRKIARLLGIAALFALPIGAACWFCLISSRKGTEQPVVADAEAEHAARASLVLADGREIDLTQTNGYIEPDRKGIVLFNGDSRLSYQDTTGAVSKDSVCYNEIKVSTCGEFQLKLSDGTVVSLNSQSRLRYPVRFSGTLREVELEGEAHFEVAKDTARPFCVHTGCYDVTVLGTSFNVHSYRDEGYSHTTLVKGCVKISGQGIRSSVLTPSEQFYLDKETGTFQVKKVDISYYVAWKEGMLRFRDERLEDIMRVLERWYGLTVFYENQEVKDYHFGFNISRDESIEPLLKIFEINGKVKITKTGQVLRIRKGRN